jgi:glutamate dehydrogenase/leucine dehydrogenase
VAVSDTGGTIYNPIGLDYQELIKIKASRKSVVDYADGNAKKAEDIFSLDVDILLPAATPDVIHKGNVDWSRPDLSCRARTFLSQELKKLCREGYSILISSNAGGVIMAAMGMQEGRVRCLRGPLRQG